MLNEYPEESLGKGTQERMRRISADNKDTPQAFHPIMLGITFSKYGYRFVRHHPKTDLLLITLSGSGIVWDGKKRKNEKDRKDKKEWQFLPAGKAYYTPSGIPHAYYTPQNQTWDLVWFIFHPPKRKRSLSPTQISILDLDPRPFQWIVEGALLGTENKLHDKASSHWLQLAHFYFEDLFQKMKSPPISRLWPIWEKVNRNLAHDWNLEKLANIIRVSPNTLRRLCLEEYGISPMKRVTQSRIEYAKGLLQSSSIPIAEIAKRVGYRDPFAFSVAFKRHQRMSPRTYRQSQFK